MKRLNLAAIVTIAAALTGCCDCFGDEPLLKVNFQNFSNAELKTIYLVSESRSDTCFSCVDTVSNALYIFPNSNTKHQILSDSIPLNKTIQINKIKSETSGFGACKCSTVKEINYDYDGQSYTNGPVVISK
ncbi:hypothetical protein [Adhaeribacter terreus]|uniref:Lipoprotein n=1 Tax=Adhaeribacter terreus TaxID=529703 RepID=A0ABW0E8V9_9BACT